MIFFSIRKIFNSSYLCNKNITRKDASVNNDALERSNVLFYYRSMISERKEVMPSSHYLCTHIQLRRCPLWWNMDDFSYCALTPVRGIMASSALGQSLLVGGILSRLSKVMGCLVFTLYRKADGQPFVKWCSSKNTEWKWGKMRIRAQQENESKRKRRSQK